jgi:stress responsive alpha/beta barrel protein
MIRHVSLLTWSPEASVDAIERAETAIRGLPDVVETIRSYSATRDAGIDSGNAQFVVVAEFDDRAGYEAYRDHPAHRRILTELARPILGGRTAAQVEI